MKTPKEPKSKCCNAPVTVEGMGDFHDKDEVCTCYHVCSKCEKPCDIKTTLQVGQPKPKYKMNPFLCILCDCIHNDEHDDDSDNGRIYVSECYMCSGGSHEKGKCPSEPFRRLPPKDCPGLLKPKYKIGDIIIFSHNGRHEQAKIEVARKYAKVPEWLYNITLAFLEGEENEFVQTTLAESHILYKL